MGSQILVSSTFLVHLPVVVVGVPHSVPAQMFLILQPGFCTFGFCLSCDLLIAEWLLTFSW
jgi:hypothetical protein